jgi:hypothetical protein
MTAWLFPARAFVVGGDEPTRTCFEGIVGILIQHRAGSPAVADQLLGGRLRFRQAAAVDATADRKLGNGDARGVGLRQGDRVAGFCGTHRNLKRLLVGAGCHRVLHVVGHGFLLRWVHTRPVPHAFGIHANRRRGPEQGRAASANHGVPPVLRSVEGAVTLEAEAIRPRCGTSGLRRIAELSRRTNE